MPEPELCWLCREEPATIHDLLCRRCLDRLSATWWEDDEAELIEPPASQCGAPCP